MKFFNATRKASMIGDGTVGDLVDWIEKLVNILFPDNGIEYWADNHHGGVNALKRFQPVPGVGSADQHIHHVACYVRQGNCEGKVIEVALYLRNGTTMSLSWAKTFGSCDESWLIARAIDAALNNILFWHEVPEIVDMADKLPRQQNWHRKTNLRETVTLAATSRKLVVATASGIVLDHRDWSEKGDNAKFCVEALLLDWKTVLANMKASFVESAEKREVIDELPGYLFTDRGVEGCTGVYVLPPGGRANFDVDWLGFFPNIDAAVAAATGHRDKQQKKAA